MDLQNKKKLLLVEDDVFLVNMYKSKLEDEGYDLLVANNGEEGLFLAQKEEIDLLILDLMLPKMSGVVLLEKLRETKPDLPVLILTNLTDEEEAKKTLSLGVKEFVVKSDITPNQLVEKISEYF
jgi:two-component system, OmpR family, alkaline phosphatase synthesis response regulator PhoP